MVKGERALVPPVYSGVSFLMAWVFLLFYARSAGIEAAAPISLMSSQYMVSALCMTVMMLLIAFLPIPRRNVLVSNFAKAITPLGMSFGTLLMIFPESIANLPFVIAGCVLTGAFSGVMAHQWVVAFSRVGLKTIICSFPALMAVAVCASMTLMYLPREILLAATVAFPCISEVLFHMVRLDLYPRYELETGPRNQPMNFLLLVIPVAVFGLSSGFLDFFSVSSNYTFVFYAFASVVPLFVCYAFVRLNSKQDFYSACMLPTAFFLAALAPLFSLSHSGAITQFISVGELGLEIALFAIAMGFAEYFSLSPLKTYALTRATMVLSNTAGWYVAEYVCRENSALVSSQLSLLGVFIGIEALAICLVISIVKAGKVPVDGSTEAKEDSKAPPRNSADAAVVFENLESQGPSAPFVEEIPSMNPLGEEAKRSDPAAVATSELSDGDRLQLFCAKIQEDCGLSARELDVLRLLVYGYSSACIQKQLYIAAGTVNYHTRNIYAKLGVHSKQEIIELYRDRS